MKKYTRRRRRAGRSWRRAGKRSSELKRRRRGTIKWHKLETIYISRKGRPCPYKGESRNKQIYDRRKYQAIKKHPLEEVRRKKLVGRLLWTKGRHGRIAAATKKRGVATNGGRRTR